MGDELDEGGGKMSKQRKLPFVWELNYRGTKSYAVGTDHVAPNCFNEDALRVLRGKRKLLLEANPFDQTYIKIADNLCSSTLEDTLTKNEIKELSKIFSLPVSQLRAAPLTAIFPSLLYRIGYGIPASVDSVLARHAYLQGVEIVQLEHQRKRNLTRDYVNDEYAKIIRNLIENERKKTGYWMTFTRNYVREYLNGDETPLKRKHEKEHGNTNIDQERNRLIVKTSLPHMKAPCVVAVGLAHYIIEPDSMLTLYRERGIKVKRIK